ncbi:MAG: glycosyltransferase [Chloroflexota bacterium]
MSDRAPDAVRRLVAERSEARAARDFDRADALRDSIHALGWEVQDARSGPTLRPILPSDDADAGFISAESLASRLDEAPTVRLSVLLVADDHVDDLARTVAGLGAHPPPVSWELVVVANATADPVEPAIEGVAAAEEVTVLATSERLGYADAVNLGLRRAMGEVVLLLDTSLEPTGDWAAPLLAAFSDPGVGVAGGWGVRSGNGRQFDDAPPGEVDAVEGYCLAVRRDVLREAGLFDRRFRWYRNADLDFSFQARAAGWRAVRTAALPFTRHEHRGYAAFEEPELTRQSKRNFYRFLKRWGDRRDLLLEPGPEHQHHDHDHEHE